ncbi:hypothetical protein [Actinoplanes regularis]|uniref:CYTH domain-containing protein n=1 Tax=Actinoplanes regularis TaxID=52697 RepID=A0A238YAB6_9ACTN|nr:hypothetical protein [Actinoplanes regularis]GIE86039.1 hypothetical protein Are01nite_25190 [Actinoplanes regularis]GLW27737.1 hypothetical protein Areg01_06770 [Actinoplanes regularis]SNR68206.1 hypothetical protein SAMN06264365_104410 [Actinoplanes regularis]
MRANDVVPPSARRRGRHSDHDPHRPSGRHHARNTGKWGYWSPPVDRSGRTLKLTDQAERVELKVVSSERQCRSLEIERAAAQTRRVFFLDTPDLALYRNGLVVRIRDMGHRSDDAVVKLRPMASHTVPKWLRRQNALEVEIDAMPGHRVCSGSLKVRLGRGVVARAGSAARPLTKLLAQPQRRLLAACGPDDLALDDLVVFGPVEVQKYRFRPEGFDRRLAAERWTFPDGSTLLELSTRCPVGEAPEVAARLTDSLSAHGVSPARSQLTKTEMTLRFFTADRAA